MSALARKSSYLETANRMKGDWEARPVATHPNLVVLAGGKVNQITGFHARLRGSSPIVFVTCCGVFLVLALATVLVLNTSVVNRSYEMARLQTKVQIVEQDVQTKQEQIRRAQASLPAKAQELGMVPIETMDILDVSKYAAEIANQMTGDVGARG